MGPPDEYCQSGRDITRSLYSIVIGLMGNQSRAVALPNLALTTKHAFFCTQLSEYQYDSYLLDPSLEEMVTILIAPIRKVVHDVTIGDFKGQPMNEHGHLVFYMLYFISKTRGYKTVVKFLPHEVADVEPTFEFLRMLNLRKTPWETRYVLLIWLSLMCMIPFDLKSIDSQASKASDRIPLVDQMIETAKTYLDRAGKDRDAASLFLARLLTRKDTCDLYLPEFVDWAKSALSSSPIIFLAIGLLGTLCWIFKIGQREVLLPIAESLEDFLVFIESRELFMSNSTMKKLIVKLSQRVGLCLLKPRVAAWRYQRGNRSLASNLGMDLALEAGKLDKISTAIAEDTEDDENFDVPEAIEDVIERLMNGLRDRDTIVRWSAAKGMGRISNRLPKDMADDVVGSIFELFSEDVFELPNGEPDVSSVSEHTWHGACLAVAELSRRGLLLPHRLAELIPWIILALRFDIKRGAHSVGSNVRDSACYVCWSFARAYTPDVLDAHVRKLSNTLIAVSVFDRDINIRRASSAAFQENVGRMGIFPHGIEIVTVADYFSVGNISNSFLTVAPFIAGFPEYRRYLSEHLLEFVIPHWDIAVREVAAESMARIAVLDLDYACSDIIPSLIRMASSLDSAIRHGALITLGKTCKAVKAHLSQPLDQCFSAEALESIANVVPSVPEFALSGFGSEHIRQALCVHITSLSEAAWPINASAIESWKNIVYTTLERVEEPLQKLASDTFRAFVVQYGLSDSEFEYCLNKASPPPNTFVDRLGQRGFALALGEIDYREAKNVGWVSRVVEALAVTADHTSAVFADAEARRNSVNAVTNIIRVLDRKYQQVISPELSKKILEIYFKGLEDYSIDHRGDVGSWSREASMLGLEVMVPLVARLDAEAESSSSSAVRYLSDEDHTLALSKLLQQSVEKIDRIRACAAMVMTTILYTTSAGPSSTPAEQEVEQQELSSEYVLRAAHREQVMQVLPKNDDMNWLQASEVYPRVVQLLNLPEYRSDLLVGFIVSAGGLTESLVRHSSACLTEFVSNLPITRNDMETDNDGDSAPYLTLVEFGNEIMKVVERYEGQDRVIVPLLEVLDMLFESGCMLMMEGEYDFAPMVRFVRRQTIKCKDTRKLSASIRTFCGLCALGGKIKNAILLELLRLLVHPFPKIRRTTADSMYLMLNVDEPTPETEKVGEILVNSDWNQSVAMLTPLRDQIYPLLHLEKPKPVPTTAALRAK
ncbi:tubulin folding cofactor D C terminal-domain-containing protein [Gamsiella multidivaricata]|uniref:tubulin folding cofactor D C terminal-domain-containing protein n=1 Tax=Gamsiella multidivaricata TaxID=101098 RepID=UPI00221F4469|nr:tubulin folding cofactor D C terminal-domain-containing protein [Gamsiella multidivaricata]KAI7830495.1 tubulin folding cofactor D C terminal-domain-containing protein [Gamsiella multidivaricata]